MTLNERCVYHLKGEKPLLSLFQVVSWVAYFTRLGRHNSALVSQTHNHKPP